MVNKKIEAGGGLESMKSELNIPWLREITSNEDKKTIESLMKNMTIVSNLDDGSQILENKSGIRFLVSGEGLSKRITRITPDE